ncbi:MAG TPA: hypothetical protein VK993_05650 [Chthoniobacterales bacterium]|nr:hypothetical protein [Chthoniobacterales bacterium]
MRLAEAPGGLGESTVGDTRAALAYIRGALKLQEGLAADFPNNLAYRHALVAGYSKLGLIYSAMGEREEQLEQHRKALAAARTLAAAEPQHSVYRRELAVAHRNVGAALGAAAPAETTQHFQEALDIFTDIGAADPKHSDLPRQWALTHLAKSRFEVEMDKPAAAMASAREGIRIVEKVVAASAGDAAAQNTLALLFTQLGASHEKAAMNNPREWANAKDAYSKGLTIYEKLEADGKLSAADANKRDKLAREIANCDAALEAQANATSR